MICFEVSGKQEQVRSELASKGYMSSWRIQRGKDEITYHLPSNALWKKGENFSPAKAKEDLKKSCTAVGVKVVRAMAVAIGKWDGMTGSSADSGSSRASQAMEAAEETSHE
jgi:hypothetical protein